MNIRNPLSERESVLSSDVADAIENLVRRGMNLPLPINKDMVIDELIQLAHLQEDGTIAPISKIVERALGQSFANRLTNSSLFSAGYQHYEERAKLPVIPVTEFFFKVVWSNGGDPSVTEFLDAMSDFEIGQSLPKRSSPIRPDPGAPAVRDNNGDILHSGSIAGIIVFPANDRSRLLRTWLERRANVATGQMAAVVDNLGHARPGSPVVDHLREHVNTVRPSLRKALPLPKK